jgi:2-polyprenyl-6-hydroxyphenyl methylase/3-demethylubiquinone-9 3-methyltransferase
MSHPSMHPAQKKGDYRGLRECEKYDATSSQTPECWYDPQMGLQRLERLRFPYFEAQLGPFAGKRVLDVGCGGGILAEDLARAGARVTGVDVSAVTLELARRHAQEIGLAIDYRHGFAEEMSFDGEFDIVFAVDSLEHVDDLDRTLSAIARALVPGGSVGFLTHNQTPDAFMEIIWKWEYEGESAKGSHDFHKFIAPADLSQRLAGLGVRVGHVQGIAWTDPPSLVDDPRISYMGAARKSG